MAQYDAVLVLGYNVLDVYESPDYGVSTLSIPSNLINHLEVLDTKALTIFLAKSLQQYSFKGKKVLILLSDAILFPGDDTGNIPYDRNKIMSISYDSEKGKKFLSVNKEIVDLLVIVVKSMEASVDAILPLSFFVNSEIESKLDTAGIQNIFSAVGDYRRYSFEVENRPAFDLKPLLETAQN